MGRPWALPTATMAGALQASSGLQETEMRPLEVRCHGSEVHGWIQNERTAIVNFGCLPARESRFFDRLTQA